MILPKGHHSNLSSAWANNFTLLEQQRELVVWSAWSLSDSWNSWTVELELSTDRITTARRERPALARHGAAPSDSSYPVLFLVLSSAVSVLILVLLCVCLSGWLARRKWRREILNLNIREQFQFHWNVVDHRYVGDHRYIEDHNWYVVDHKECTPQKRGFRILSAVQ